MQPLTHIETCLEAHMIYPFRESSFSLVLKLKVLEGLVPFVA